jgi:F-type H+-transporting ATPase subunit delta
LVIARRYAKALLLIGKEDDQTEVYRKELEGVTNLFASGKELEQAVCNPLYNVEQRQKVLAEIIDKLKLSQVMSSFLNLLFAKRRIVYLNSINEFYQKLADQLNGIERASLISAIELSSETVDKISQSLKKITGKEIILEKELDPGLIGGVVTKIGDLILDGSIKTQLLNMRESLKRGESV